MQTLADPRALASNLSLDPTSYSGPSSNVTISPDSHWVFQVTEWSFKIVHSESAYQHPNAYLYEVTQIAPLKLRPYFKDGSFAQAAFRNFTASHGTRKYLGITFRSWNPGKLFFCIMPDDSINSQNGECDEYEFDLNTGTFSEKPKP